MARLVPINAKNGENVGFAVGGLPMPDGSRRDYVAVRKNGLYEIMQRWQAEREKMLKFLKLTTTSASHS